MASPVNPGDLLAGRYLVERVLGEGGMGIVLAAQHQVLGERVAVKLLLPEAAKVPGVIQRFQREARAAARIQSEHVARVMDVGLLDETTPYLVMEYVEGRDLDAELEARGPLPVEEAVAYVMQAMVGVAGAHALGIVHRDLKPANLFLARQPNGRTLVKVLDFGIAKDMADKQGADLTNSFSALGSASYMSPEQVRTAKSVDARADVWAFGVILFELLTGRMPFEGESLTAVIAAITADAPLPLQSLRSDVPAGLADAVARCLQKDRDLRFRSLGDLAIALQPFGGRSAPVLAARVNDALSEGPGPIGEGAPPSAVSSNRATSRSRPEDATRPAWSTSGDAAPSTSAPAPNRRVLVFATAAVGLVGLATLIVVYSGSGAGQAVAEAPSPPSSGAPVVAPEPSVPAVVVAPAQTPRAAPDAGSPTSRTLPPAPVPTAFKPKVSSPSVKPKPARPPAAKKPLVTDL